MRVHLVLAETCLKQSGSCGGAEWADWLLVIGIGVAIAIFSIGWLLSRFGSGRTAQLLRAIQNKPKNRPPEDRGLPAPPGADPLGD